MSVLDSFLLVLHSWLRWIILILLIVGIINSIAKMQKPLSSVAKKMNLWLMVAAHITLLIGLYQYFFGPKGFIFFRTMGAATVMKDAVLRFWAVEHITGMIIAIILITLTRGVAKKEAEPSKKNKKLLLFYVLALIIILASIPWPGRFGDVPLFRGF
ncbi:MAG: hypothetical protein GTN67_11860 [Hydrotalea flava]|nr:hypothetical protein [Hydrotalea flava]NIM38878.1 hypothetical protein [Hydrotalea flava]NIN04068.1 hypothetical protein [Hydrotalea flava]NIN15773.1 hypothetical protein [Hydrotalea flava]NIO94804.1 hypothetical protein [Hydrotalea flava]